MDMEITKLQYIHFKFIHLRITDADTGQPQVLQRCVIIKQPVDVLRDYIR